MNKKSKGISLGCLDVVVITLQTMFIVFKLVGLINWSWWWVLAPAWIYIIILICLVIGIFIGKSINNKGE